MPCYCESPSDEKEVINRIKVRMYFDAVSSLDDIQKKIAIENNLRLCPMEPDIDLCKICKILSVEQMKQISGYFFGFSELIKNLYEWYKKHLSDDYEHNDNKEEKEIALKELQRLKDDSTT